MIANLEGTWNKIKEFVLWGGPLLVEGQPISIVWNDNGNFNVTLPLLNSPDFPLKKELGDLPPILDENLRPTLSTIWEDDTWRYGLRLVFDIDANTSQLVIVEGPLGSTIERWPKIQPSDKPRQPNDMGVITGTKTGTSTKRE